MIDFKDVSKTYPNGTHALYNINLHIDKGEFVFIVGASGAGKSTFLKLIMHEEVPSNGNIIVNKVNTTKMRRRQVPYLRRRMGIVFQDFRLIEKMNVFDNVAFAMRAIGANSGSIKKRVPYILNLVGLSHKMKSKPSELSGGEQQRVSLARALVNNPEIIIADEPTGNVDPEMSHEIIELLNEINSMGTTVIVVTHEHDLVREFNKRVIVIDHGRIKSDTKNEDKSESKNIINENSDAIVNELNKTENNSVEQMLENISLSNESYHDSYSDGYGDEEFDFNDMQNIDRILNKYKINTDINTNIITDDDTLDKSEKVKENI